MDSGSNKEKKHQRTKQWLGIISSIIAIYDRREFHRDQMVFVSKLNEKMFILTMKNQHIRIIGGIEHSFEMDMNYESSRMPLISHDK